jgi:hypothetical protein
MRAAAIGVLLAALPALALAHEATEEQCKAMVKGAADGQFATVAVPGLRLVGAGAARPLPPLPDGTTMVVCGRDSIIPTPNDARVLTDYHMPLSITDGERVAFLELFKGQVMLRIAQGELTPAETREVQPRLDAIQARFNASAEAHGR